MNNQRIINNSTKILLYLEKYRGITTEQCANIFYKGERRSAVRKLHSMVGKGLLDSFNIGMLKVYTTGKKISRHDLYVMDFYAWVIANNGSVIDFKLTPRLLNGLLIPDALCKIKLPYRGKIYSIYALLEIDYTHYTGNDKLNVLYERLYSEGELSDYCGEAEFPILIIARQKIDIKYRSNNFEVIYTDFNYTNLINFIFN